MARQIIVYDCDYKELMLALDNGPFNKLERAEAPDIYRIIPLKTYAYSIDGEDDFYIMIGESLDNYRIRMAIIVPEIKKGLGRRWIKFYSAENALEKLKQPALDWLIYNADFFSNPRTI